MSMEFSDLVLFLGGAFLAVTVLVKMMHSYHNQQVTEIRQRIRREKRRRERARKRAEQRAADDAWRDRPMSDSAASQPTASDVAGESAETSPTHSDPH